MSTVAMMAATGASAPPPIPVQSVVVAATANRYTGIPWTSPSGPLGTSSTFVTTAPSGTMGRCDINPLGTVALLGGSGTPFFTALKISDTGAVISTYTAASPAPAAGFGSSFNAIGTVAAYFPTTTPFVFAHAWNDVTGFGTRYANPPSLPTGGFARQCTWNAANTVVVMAYSSTPFIAAWEWNDVTGFGTRYANPATLLTANCQGVAFHPSGTQIVAATSSGMFSYEWNDITGFGARSAALGGTNDNFTSVQFHPSGNALLAGLNAATPLRAWQWGGAGGSLGAQYANPVGGQTTSPGTIYIPSFNKAGTAVAGTSSTANNARVWPFDTVNGFGTGSNSAISTTSFLYAFA